MKASRTRAGTANGAGLTARRRRRIGSMVAIGVLLALSGGAVVHAGVSVGGNIVYFHSSGPGEGMSVSSDGKFILVSSPVILDPAETLFSSSMPAVIHKPLAPEPFILTQELDLTAFGEITDVAVLPQGPHGLAVVRADADTPVNALLAIRGQDVVQILSIPAPPDGMKVSPDGRYAIVAVEKGGDIRVYDLEGGVDQIQLAAIVTHDALAAYYAGAPNPADAIEPEAVGISADSSFALVTIQDSSSLAALSLDAVTLALQQGLTLTPEEIGDLALKNVLHLPYGFIGNNGALFGVEPDGVGISPDGSFAMVAHEANNRAKHLAGFSVVDLRNGLENITAQSYCIYDIDPTLLQNTGLAACPMASPGDPYPVDANRLPRLDPASVEIIHRGGQTVAVLVIERYDPSAAQLAASPVNERRGSVLFLEAGQALNGVFPKIDRVPIGVSGSRLEGLESAQGGRWIFVSISNGGGDRGTFARLELLTP